MKGSIFSLNISDAKGVAKTPVREAVMKEDSGVAGDVHAGQDQDKQVSLLSWESIQRKNFCLKKEDAKLKPGDFAENITTLGIDLSALKIGDRLRAAGVILEISRIGKKCHVHCDIYRKIGGCIMPKEGMFARVVRGGKIKAGDGIEKIE